MRTEEKKKYLMKYRFFAAALRRTEKQIAMFGKSEEILSEQLKNKRLLLKIKEEIDLIEEPVLREVLTQKYLMNIPLKTVGDNLNYSPRQIARLHKKALELFNIL